ncbi:MAG: aminopeptidase P family protein [Erysipelotrichales bacterium]|nr:aminopeptidase P family protein [Erysipelotrichales bacterium]
MKKIYDIQNMLRNIGTKQVMLYDTLSIYYAIGAKFYPHERFLALLVKDEGKPVLFLNNLFPCEELDGIEIVRFNDNDDYLGVFCNYLVGGKLAVDKNLPSRFLLPIMEKHHDVCISSVVEDLRLAKDQDEVQKMRASSRLNDEIMEQVEKFLHVGVSDKEVEEYIFSLYKKYNVVPSFEPIVAFKNTASDPHASANGQILTEEDVCIVDMGLILDDYCSDMTRTFVYNYPKMEEIYRIVLKANLAAESMIRPGVKFSDIDKAARSVIEAAGYGEYFTHRTGHGIGLEVHEPKDVSSANDDVVREGYCFSIEPGIYLPGVGGVRIEDLVVVTADGCEVLNLYRK